MTQPNTDPNQFTETALSVAIKKGNLRMVHIIMKHGAQRPHKVRVHGGCALKCTTSHGMTAVQACVVPFR